MRDEYVYVPTNGLFSKSLGWFTGATMLLALDVMAAVQNVREHAWPALILWLLVLTPAAIGSYFLCFRVFGRAWHYFKYRMNFNYGKN